MSASRFLYRLKALLRRSQMQDDLSKELQFHLQKEIERNITAGMIPDEARYSVLRSFGGLDQVKEQCQDFRTARFVDAFLQDVKYDRPGNVWGSSAVVPSCDTTCLLHPRTTCNQSRSSGGVAV